MLTKSLGKEYKNADNAFKDNHFQPGFLYGSMQNYPTKEGCIQAS